MTVYKIEYSGNIVQQKMLITQEQYNEIVKPITKVIYTLEYSNKGKPTKESAQLKKILKQLFPIEFFVENSPLHQAIKTGELVLPSHQGGIHKVKIKKL